MEALSASSSAVRSRRLVTVMEISIILADFGYELGSYKLLSNRHPASDSLLARGHRDLVELGYTHHAMKS